MRSGCHAHADISGSSISGDPDAANGVKPAKALTRLPVFIDARPGKSHSV